MAEYKTGLLIVGGGAGGCAAALSACSVNLNVIMTEETDWIGGQLTSQAAPPDEHHAIETHGCTGRYREFRNKVRQYYKDNYPLTTVAQNDPFLNPGKGNVSKLCFEPRVGLHVLQQMLACSVASNKLKILLKRKPVEVDLSGDSIISVALLNSETGERDFIEADYILDATELGDLLALSGSEYVVGAESADETGEPHAVSGPAQPDNVQSFTWCLAVGYDPKCSHIIDKPSNYQFWKNFTPSMSPPWSGRLLSWTYSQPWTLKPQASGIGLMDLPIQAADTSDLWRYRRLLCSDHYNAPIDEVTLINWPQNDYVNGNIIDKSEDEIQKHLHASKDLSLSLLYWLQTEAPRPDGGIGYPGLYPRPDITGTEDGLAKYPYIRESRRIKALFTITELHVTKESSDNHTASFFKDSVGIGSYHIDLHPSSGGNNYIHCGATLFQIPLRSMIPVRMKNLIPACKNIGTTHITNGCYRLHPVEWNIGESAGLLAAFCLQNKVYPRQVAERGEVLGEFQKLLADQKIELEWPSIA
ncbi:MAG: FAD-dependent oxidoreductase [Verrucomicrobia bacterium]|nr:FAD-dependent oxidoreductase [Verrucomicrobiota bacterium]MCG2680138.1 FAD-dependent oxidoreductase [Kiritimatiellia bacterium]MBU4247047.1 FAD-dependent oxidoreductase [Verrucomicrobiota bacterium]MBU4291121.1 FAD-dependent oxidoreductase [Verrucomicrobiota bacterium]MBU4429510.1 FAD-dependent oxidoreductase [Verrucomicrobiota bacterium]